MPEIKFYVETDDSYDSGIRFYAEINDREVAFSEDFQCIIEQINHLDKEDIIGD